MHDTEGIRSSRSLAGGLRSPLAALRIEPELVCEFFAVFSRFEFALKAHGYMIARRYRAEPDWWRFAEEVDKKPMSEIIFVVEHAPEGGFTARALGESIVTQAETIPDLRTRVRDAVQCHFDEGMAPK